MLSFPSSNDCFPGAANVGQRQDLHNTVNKAAFRQPGRSMKDGGVHGLFAEGFVGREFGRRRNVAQNDMNTKG